MLLEDSVFSLFPRGGNTQWPLDLGAFLGFLPKSFPARRGLSHDCLSSPSRLVLPMWKRGIPFCPIALLDSDFLPYKQTDKCHWKHNNELINVSFLECIHAYNREWTPPCIWTGPFSVKYWSLDTLDGLTVMEGWGQGSIELVPGRVK